MNLAGRVARFIAAEIDRQHRDFLRSAEPSHGWRSIKACRTVSTPAPLAFACASIRSSREGDWMVPGQIALARTPFLMKSAATAFVRPITAALLAP